MNENTIRSKRSSFDAKSVTLDLTIPGACKARRRGLCCDHRRGRRHHAITDQGSLRRGR